MDALSKKVKVARTEGLDEVRFLIGTSGGTLMHDHQIDSLSISIDRSKEIAKKVFAEIDKERALSQ